MTTHTFGGDWTGDKLERLRKYLAAYTTIFDKNERARKLKTIYVDAFAGTEYRARKTQPNYQSPLFPELAEPEAAAFLDGSARIALGVEPPFKQYLLIERDPARAQALQQLKHDFPDKQIEIVKEDANNYLTQWCAKQDWRYSRAVVFLDPYGMQVSWDLIEALAGTDDEHVTSVGWRRRAPVKRTCCGMITYRQGNLLEADVEGLTGCIFCRTIVLSTYPKLDDTTPMSIR